MFESLLALMLVLALRARSHSLLCAPRWHLRAGLGAIPLENWGPRSPATRSRLKPPTRSTLSPGRLVSILRAGLLMPPVMKSHRCCLARLVLGGRLGHSRSAGLVTGSGHRFQAREMNSHHRWSMRVGEMSGLGSPAD